MELQELDWVWSLAIAAQTVAHPKRLLLSKPYNNDSILLRVIRARLSKPPTTHSSLTQHFIGISVR
jgi:hypothetical protein